MECRGNDLLPISWNLDLHSICFEDAHDRGVYETLPGHEGLVTSLRFVDESTFVSADDKGVLRVWRRAFDQACLPPVYVETPANDIPFAVEDNMRETSTRKIYISSCSARNAVDNRLIRFESEDLARRYQR